MEDHPAPGLQLEYHLCSETEQWTTKRSLMPRLDRHRREPQDMGLCYTGQDQASGPGWLTRTETNYKAGVLAWTSRARGSVFLHPGYKE